ncbi:MAG: serine hydrolase [Gemmatimonadota bacterium]
MTFKTLRLLSVLALQAGVPPALIAQTVQGTSLRGDWVRVVSNNNRNDQMRIHVDGDATLTVVPSSSTRYWQVGQILWRAIQPSGEVAVRGSDGSYYPGAFTWQGSDTLRLHVQASGAGYDQTWTRAGPSVLGDWVRIAPPGDPEDGMRVQATGSEASIRYLPAAAPRSFRVGRRLWQGIRAQGALDVLGSDGRYHPATVTLLGTDSLRIDSASPMVSNGAIWVRPTAVAAARTAPAGPPANPNAPGSGLQPPAGPPGVTPPTTFTPPPASGACVATSTPLDAEDVRWQWGLTVPVRNDSLAEVLGVQEAMMSGLPSGPALAPVDLEHSLLPGFPDGFAFIHEARSRRIQTQHHLLLTRAELDQRMQAARSAGLRPTDVEAYDTPAGVRYAGIWETNLQGVDWRVDVEVTSAELANVLRSSVPGSHRLVDLEVRSTPNGLLHSAIWYRSCDASNWSEVRGMDSTAFRQRIQTQSAAGFQVIDVESYETSGGQRYAAVWEAKDPARGWAVEFGRDLNGFLNDHRRYEDQGMRLVDYESYTTAAGPRYAGVWAENDDRYDMPFRMAIDTVLTTYVTTNPVPGVSVVVMRDGEVLYRGGAGQADRAAQKDAHSGTLYPTASVAKAIAATLAVRLESRGLIDLTRRTSDYVSVPNASHTHTLEQLLSKTGCVWHYPQGPEPPERFYMLRDSVIAQYSATDSIMTGCIPGSHYHYSTHGFTFVGAALEKVTGKDIVQLLRDEIVEPFGLWSLDRSSDVGPVFGVPWFNQAQLYSYDTTTVQGQPVGLTIPRRTDDSWKILGGGLQADARDLARFGELTLMGQIADTARLWTSHTDNTRTWSRPRRRVAPPVGLAWVLGTANAGRPVAMHGGYALGARSWLGLWRGPTAQQRLVVAVLSNQENTFAGGATDIQGLGTRIARLVFLRPPPPP